MSIFSVNKITLVRNQLWYNWTTCVCGTRRSVILDKVADFILKYCNILIFSVSDSNCSGVSEKSTIIQSFEVMPGQQAKHNTDNQTRQPAAKDDHKSVLPTKDTLVQPKTRVTVVQTQPNTQVTAVQTIQLQKLLHNKSYRRKFLKKYFVSNGKLRHAKHRGMLAQWRHGYWQSVRVGSILCAFWKSSHDLMHLNSMKMCVVVDIVVYDYSLLFLSCLTFSRQIHCAFRTRETRKPFCRGKIFIIIG